MRTSHRDWPRLPITGFKALGCGVLGLCCLAFILIVHQFVTPPSTHAVSSESSAPTLTINAGFDDAYREGYWTPVRVTISNNGPPFQGKLSVRTFAGNTREQMSGDMSPWSFEQPISLGQGTEKQLTIYAPHYTGNLITRGFLTSLLNEKGQTVTSQVSQPGYEVQPGNMLVGIFTDDNDLLAQLGKILLPNQSDSVTISKLNTHTMPTTETVLENFDVIVLANFPTRTLTIQQLATLHTWVNRGGILIMAGGSNWQNTLAPLPPDLLPVTIQGTKLIPPQTHLLSFNGIPMSPPAEDIAPAESEISTASIQKQNVFTKIQTLLSAENTPLLVKAYQGSGVICYLAFDPAAPPLNHWAPSIMLWQMLFQEALGERLLIANSAQSYEEGPGELLTRGGIMNFLTPGMPSGPMTIGILLACYLLLLGPIRLILLYRYKLIQVRQWRMIISTIVIFSLLAYGLAYYQKKSAVTENSVSIIRMNQDGTSAHITTYMGVLTPQSGDMRLQIPGNSLAEPIDHSFLNKNPAISLPNASTPTTVTANSSETSLTMHNKNLWSLNPVITEQDQQLQGKLSGHIILRNNRLVGSITNALQTSLRDVYILLPHNFIPVGHLAPQETREISFPLQNVIPAPELTLSDLIAKHAGLPAQYFPYQEKQHPQNEFQTHIAMLSALSGVGYTYPPCESSCLTHAITSKGVIYVTGGQIPDPNLKNDYDPLLIQGAPATLIGWADQNITSHDKPPTINNVAPQGQHMNFIQMPLSVSYSGLFNIPLDFITGNLIDVESYDAGAILRGAYSLSTGFVTFDLPLPDTPHGYISSATITVPDLLAHPSGPGSGSNIHATNIHTQLYNWNTHLWDQVNLDQDSFTTRQPEQYVGPYARFLVRVSSQNTNQIYFGKPSLYLNGNAN